jgi:hypothetical protein
MVRQTFEQVVAFPGEVGVIASRCAGRRHVVFFVLDVINSSALWSPVRVEKLVKSLRIDRASLKTGICVVELGLRSSIVLRSADP